MLTNGTYTKMSMFKTSRRKLIAKSGRAMTLRRLTKTGNTTLPANTDVQLTGYINMYRPEQVGQGGIMQGDALVYITNDEISDAGFSPAPTTKDQMIIDSKIWIIMGVYAVNDGSNLIGYNLFVRGG